VALANSSALKAADDASEMAIPVTSTGITVKYIVCEATIELLWYSVTMLCAALGVALIKTLTTRLLELVSGKGVGVGLLELSWRYVMYGSARDARSVELRESSICPSPAHDSRCPDVEGETNRRISIVQLRFHSSGTSPMFENITKRFVFGVYQ
jgi:hypothetical protein